MSRDGWDIYGDNNWEPVATDPAPETTPVEAAPVPPPPPSPVQGDNPGQAGGGWDLYGNNLWEPPFTDGSEVISSKLSWVERVGVSRGTSGRERG